MEKNHGTRGVFVSGIGTEVGKTVASAILVRALGADYWKPVQSGDLHWTDSQKVQQWNGGQTTIHPEAYRLRTPMSPHAAAAIDQVQIELARFALPETDNFLVVEGAGGLQVPLNEQHTMLDLIGQLGLPVVLVSRHYLGSINHTLLSLEALHRRSIPLAGLIFNGPAHPTTEQAISQISGTTALLRIEDLPEVNPVHVKAEADRLRPVLEAWKQQL